MILKISILSFILSAVWVAEVWGAPYSNVYFQSKSEYTPVEYIRYNAPSVPIGAQLAQISAPPVQSAIPVSSYVSPCGSTCLISGQNLAPIATASNILSYKSPISNVPVVLPRDESTSYQYSYIVYDDHTGDQKAQREQSDGSVVRGEYSLIQPDGYVREVQYIADDANGFNAIVKNFLPGPVGETNKVEHVKENHPATLPCIEVTHEHSTQHAVGHEIKEPHHSHQALIEAHHNTKVDHHDEKQESDANPVEHYPHHEVHHEHSERHEHLKELKHGHAEEPTHGSSDVVHHTEIHVVHAEEIEHPSESHSEHSEAHHSEAHHSEAHHSEALGHDNSESHTTENHDHKEEVHHGHEENDSHGHIQEHNEPKKEYVEDSSSDSSESSSNESLEKQMFLLRAHDGKFSESDESSSESEEDFEELQDGHEEKHQAEHEQSKDHQTAHHGDAEQHVESHQVVAHPADAHHEKKHSEQLKEHGHTELIELTGAHHEHTKEQSHDETSGVAYSDIIRCVNTAMNTVPSSHNTQPSPLTYIILNKPC